MSLEMQAAIASNCRHLLARILYQALRDEKLDRRPQRGWPWENWHPRLELDAFWQSEWFEGICEWLDIQPGSVVELARKARRNGRSD